ncbi:hypothetical protein Mmc1_1487 [Magnetococcus marinus MC-1]|uniref:Uncharacterized protein n=1 Tax=Magnetococcus marinus (strain ATCC BAA-1437 / JCM 17883 / MC-1) TaxID=156889 RepID=A0L7Q3_MAGMM|nr:hypothetical protein [Magnetococcus marinus]ABK43996.1 hypothetical protein Mmc1_1487 [Magnetococcus marinus MC-1]
MSSYSDEAYDELHATMQGWLRDFNESDAFAALDEAIKPDSSLVISLFVDLMYTYHERLPAKWSAASVEQCCIETIPHKAMAGEGFFLSVNPVLKAFFVFLEEQGAIKNARVLARTMDKLAKKMVAQVENRSHWDIAKQAPASNAEHTVASTASMKPRSSEWVPRVKPEELDEGLSLFEAMDDDSTIPDNDPKVVQYLNRQAKRIAKAVESNKKLPLDDKLIQMLDEHPYLLFDMLDELSEERDDGGSLPPSLAMAYLILVSTQLQQIRAYLEAGYDWAVSVVAEFQEAVIEAVSLELISPSVLESLLHVLEDAGIDPMPELIKVHDQLLAAYVAEMDPSEESVQGLIEELLEHHEGNPFGVCETLIHTTRSMDMESQDMAIGTFINSTLPEVRDAVSLLVLSPNVHTRRSVLLWLHSNAENLTPTALRRLIVVRNWLPKDERKQVDEVTRKARRKGVQCAQWSAGNPVTQRIATTVDGAGAQAFLVITQYEKKWFRAVSLLIKQGKGVADVWHSEPMPQSEVDRLIRENAQVSLVGKVSEAFLNRLVSYAIEVGLQQNTPPPLQLLEVAELLGAQKWVPVPLDLAARMDEILTSAETPSDQLFDEEIDLDLLMNANYFRPVKGVTDSWFVEGQALMDFLNHTRIRKQERLVDRVLKDFVEPQRAWWAEKVGMTALVMAEQGKQAIAYRCALLSKALLEGYPLHKIAFMRYVAERSCDWMSAP